MPLFKQISANKRRSIFLVIIVAGLLVALGYVLSTILFPSLGYWPLVIAFVVVVGLSIGSYWYSDKIALGINHAVQVSADQAPQLHNVVEGVCLAAGLPKPRIYIVDDPAPNAFATGRNPQHAAIAVTTGLLNIMTRDELEGVIAHELSHIRNYDILLQSMVVVMVGTIVLLSDFMLRYMFWSSISGGDSDGDSGGGDNNGGGGLQFLWVILGVALMILAPIIAKLIQLAVSRKREALADVTAIEITRYPTGLRHALEKLQGNTTTIKHASRATAHMWIESPLGTDKKDKGAWLNRLFETHPPLSQRIAVLEKLEGESPDQGSGTEGQSQPSRPGGPVASDYVHMDKIFPGQAAPQNPAGPHSQPGPPPPGQRGAEPPGAPGGHQPPGDYIPPGFPFQPPPSQGG